MSLKLCPLCESEVHLTENDDGNFIIHCSSCPLVFGPVPAEWSYTHTVKVWNDRPDDWQPLTLDTLFRSDVYWKSDGKIMWLSSTIDPAEALWFKNLPSIPSESL